MVYAFEKNSSIVHNFSATIEFCFQVKFNGKILTFHGLLKNKLCNVTFIVEKYNKYIFI